MSDKSKNVHWRKLAKLAVFLEEEGDGEIMGEKGADALTFYKWSLDVMNELVEAYPEDADYKKSLISILEKVADEELDNNEDYDKALKLYGRQLDLCAERVNMNHFGTDYSNLFRALDNIIKVEKELEHKDSLLGLYYRKISVFDEFKGRYLEVEEDELLNDDLFETILEAAKIEKENDNIDKAHELYTHAYEIMKELKEKNPEVPRYGYGLLLSESLYDLADLEGELGNTERARQIWDQALKCYSELAEEIANVEEIDNVKEYIFQLTKLLLFGYKIKADEQIGSFVNFFLELENDHSDNPYVELLLASILSLETDFAMEIMHQGHHKEGFYKLLQAAKLNSRAQKIVGQLYLTDEIVKRNLENAVYWLKKAAENGDGTAQMQLGGLYATEPDLFDTGKSQMWLRRAALSGEKLAWEALNQVRCNNNMPLPELKYNNNDTDIIYTVQTKEIVQKILQDGYYRPDFSKSPFVRDEPELAKLYDHLRLSFINMNNIQEDIRGLVFGFYMQEDDNIRTFKDINEFRHIITEKKTALIPYGKNLL